MKKHLTYKQRKKKDLSEFVKLWRKGCTIKEFSSYMTGELIRPEHFYIMATIPFRMDRMLKEIKPYSEKRSIIKRIRRYLKKHSK